MGTWIDPRAALSSIVLLVGGCVSSSGVPTRDLWLRLSATDLGGGLDVDLSAHTGNRRLWFDDDDRLTMTLDGEPVALAAFGAGDDKAYRGRPGSRSGELAFAVERRGNVDIRGDITVPEPFDLHAPPVSGTEPISLTWDPPERPPDDDETRELILKFDGDCAYAPWRWLSLDTGAYLVPTGELDRLVPDDQPCDVEVTLERSVSVEDRSLTGPPAERHLRRDGRAAPHDRRPVDAVTARRGGQVEPLIHAAGMPDRSRVGRRAGSRADPPRTGHGALPRESGRSGRDRAGGRVRSGR